VQVDALRAALARLDGTRAIRFVFTAGQTLVVEKALVIPVEEDGLLKLTDGDREVIIDADVVAWLEIELPKAP
jgi:hypothetical protein